MDLERLSSEQNVAGSSPAEASLIDSFAHLAIDSLFFFQWVNQKMIQWLNFFGGVAQTELE